MRFGRHLPLVVGATALLGCGADRTTGPEDEAARAADEFERAAADLRFAGDPVMVLTYQSAAAALRAGAPVSRVHITVGTETGTQDGVWNAIGHEIRFAPPAGADDGAFDHLSARALLAWQLTGAGMRVIHLMAEGNDSDIGNPFARDLPTVDPGVPPLLSILMYREGRDATWQALRGHQKSTAAAGQTRCPDAPNRPAGAPPPPECVLASFMFELTGVEAEPFVPPFGFGGPVPNAARGTRTLSMPWQPVTGVQTTHRLPVSPLSPIVGRLAP